MSSVKETSRRFWNKAARKYAKRPVGDEAAYAHTLERVRAHIDGFERVLDMLEAAADGLVARLRQG